MEKFLEKLFDIKKIPTKLILVFWLTSAMLLFVPKNWILKFNLTEFNIDYGKFIGITFIISSAFLIVSTFTSISLFLRRKKLRKKYKENIYNAIQRLDFHEIALLREFVINNKNTLQLPFDNDTVIGLVNKGVIDQVSSTGFTYLNGIFFNYSISKEAELYLTSHILQIPENPTESEKQQIMNSRPAWAVEKSYRENRRNSSWF